MSPRKKFEPPALRDYGAAPAVVFEDSAPAESRACIDCAQLVRHRAVRIERGCFSERLWRPVPHCPRCGHPTAQLEKKPGEAATHKVCRACAKKKPTQLAMTGGAFDAGGAYVGR